MFLRRKGKESLLRKVRKQAVRILSGGSTGQHRTTPGIFPYFCNHFMESISQLYPLLNQPKKVVITTHQKPDPDAMGSSLGLYHLLVQLGHEVQVIGSSILSAMCRSANPALRMQIGSFASTSTPSTVPSAWPNSWNR